MVSSVDNVRQWSTQTMLKVMKQTDQEQNATSGSFASRLLGDYGIDSSDDATDSGTYDLLNRIADQQDNDASSVETLKQPDSVMSPDFAAFIKQQLEAMKKEPGKAEQADSMLKALEAGTLTVADAAEGKSVQLVAPDKVSTQENKVTDLTSKDWGSFLRDHLTRENGGMFSRNKDGSYIDRQSGQNAFYGSLGDKSYYLTWPSSTTR
ncbi:hypothetical protein [Rhizobium sp. FKY42]|uniref:hypothetical protein n=1 Tax=Rhizobium sp. FKY42 TaxID=2562310 RepID=UPI0010C061D2|nr:hypothetical protein [Rhizobium sp. FKY42]